MKIRFLLLFITLQLTPLFSDIIWEADYGLMGADQCFIEPSMVLSSDGGFIIIASLGYEYWPGDGYWSTKIIKFDNIGNIVWNSYENFNSFPPHPEGLFETDSGNIIATGTQGWPDIAYASKRNSNGDTLWVKEIENIRFKSFIGNDDSGFYIGGRDISTLKACLKKVDLNGNVIWSHIYNAGSFFSSGLMTSDECFILHLFISDSAGNYNALMKTNANGDSLWTFIPEVSSIKSSIETSENNLIVSTWEHIYKIDLEGNVIDQVDGNFYYAIDLPDEDCFLTAYYNHLYDYGIVKYDYNLNQIQHLTDYQYFYFFRQLSDNGFLIYDERAIHLIRTDENLVSTENNIISNFQSQISNFPNPFNPTTTIEFSIQNNSQIELAIFNTKGQKVKTLADNQFTPGSHSVVWNGKDESEKPVCSGIYFYKLQVNGKMESMKKCLLLK